MIITPEICEALFPRGEDYDFCPKMIKHLSEADPKLRQSYLETKLFGSNIYGECVDELPLSPKGNITSEQRKLDVLANAIPMFCEKEGIILEDNFQTKLEIENRWGTMAVTLNVFPTSFRVNGDYVIGGIRFFVISNLNNPSSRYKWERIKHINTVDITTTLYILNEIRTGFDSVVSMAKKQQIHYMYWIFDLGKEVSHLPIINTPTPDKLAEGKEYFRKAFHKLKDTSWDAIPSYDVCKFCKLKCDKRIIEIVQ